MHICVRELKAKMSVTNTAEKETERETAEVVEYWTDHLAAQATKKAKLDGSGSRVIVVNDSKTPSGRIHVGSLRGILIHDAVFKSILKERTGSGGALNAGEEKNEDTRARFIYGFDDMDALDGLPVYLDREIFEKFMGHPLCNIPAPEGGTEKNFAQFFADEFVKVFEILGCHPKIYWMSELYKSGRMNDVIRTALKNASTIRKIYEETSGTIKPSDWLPFQPICDECGRIGTTRAYDFDGETVAYTCEPDMVSWANGCGHTGRKSPFDGNGKLAWKIEWAARWPVLGVQIECAGKDHFTRTGSRAVSGLISQEVYGYTPPEGFGYEFFLIGGRKMSSSKGMGVSALEISRMLPPQILRFLLIKTRPTAQLDFDPSGPALPRLFDEFDKYERMHFGIENIPPGQEVNVSRIYELCQTGRVPETLPLQVPFSHVTMLVQLFPNDAQVLEQLERSGHIESAQNPENSVLDRIEFARRWTADYAGEQFRMQVLEKLPPKVEIGEKEKTVLTALATLFEKGRPSEEDVVNAVRGAAGTAGIPARDAFGMVYKIFLGKTFGPKLGAFLLALERDFVVKRLKLSG